MTSISFEDFDCDKCGACCEALIIEADYCDAQREPKLYEISNVDRQKLREDEHCITLYDTETRSCPFLDGETKECGIYPTRPNVCVSVEAGDARCQQARIIKGLPLLQNRDGNLPSAELLAASCEEYELDLFRGIRIGFMRD